MPGLQPGRALSQGSCVSTFLNQGFGTLASFLNHIWDPAPPQNGALLGSRIQSPNSNIHSWHSDQAPKLGPLWNFHDLSPLSKSGFQK